MHTHLPMFMLWTTSEWGIALTVGLFVLGCWMSLTAWLFKKRMEAYDKHLDDCREYEVMTARMEERLHSVEGQLKGVSASVRWVGDCMLTVGAKLDVELPNRPV